MKHALEKIPIYGGLVCLVSTDNPQDLLKIFSADSLNKTEILNRDYLYAHTLWLSKDDYSCYTILLNLKNSPAGNVNHGCIAHEALHVVNMLFESRGIEYDNRNDEHAAYLLNWVTTFVYRKLEKFNELKKITIDH